MIQYYGFDYLMRKINDKEGPEYTEQFINEILDNSKKLSLNESQKNELAEGMESASYYRITQEEILSRLKINGNIFEDENKKPINLAQFALNGNSEKMEQQMLDDEYILGEIALLGQVTAIYAKPNSGKTLMTMRLLIDAIGEGNIKPENVFYINADDTYKGLVHKLKLAERYGFNMLAPGHNGFKADMLTDVLSSQVEQRTTNGVVIILDTLKKFTDIMDKRKGSDFMDVARIFVSNGGSMVLLAHVNKHRDMDGKVIFSGTSDITDDADCAYTLDTIEETETNKTIKFDNFKNRGNVAKSASYQYSNEAQSYADLMQSVRIISEEDSKATQRNAEINATLAEHTEIIQAITDCIKSGTNTKTRLVDAAYEHVDESKAKIKSVLKRHTGTNWREGHRWQMIKTAGENNMHKYVILPKFS